MHPAYSITDVSREAMQPETDFPTDLRALEQDYELIRELGQGGMAAVYLARRRETGTLVAIKAIRARYLDDPDALQRFAREARTVAGLSHPNIVATESIEEIGDRAVAIIMEYVAGGTVRDRLREYGAFSAEDTESVLRDVANALAYAHRRGIVHRDVKPENVFLDKRTGRAMLSDFGIARRMEGEVPLTMLGASLGTPQYMSPEQIDGVRVDGRSDIYSLGVLGWELLTGRRPWAGENLYGTIYKQKHEDLPRITSIRPRVPANLLFAIERALVKDRDRRWRTADEFLAQLTYSPPPIVAQTSYAPSAKSDDEPTMKFHRQAAPPPPPPNAPAPRPPASSPRAAALPPRESTPVAVRPRHRAIQLLALVVPLAIGLVSLYVLFGDRIPGSARRGSPSDVTSSAGTIALDSTPRRDSTKRQDSVAVNRPSAVVPNREAAKTPTVNRVSRPEPGTVASPAAAVPTARCDVPTIADQRACLLAYVALNDAELQRVYDSLIVERRRIARVPRRAPDPPDVAALRAEQRNWVSARDRQCMATRTARTGPLWGKPLAACFKQLSDARADELRGVLSRARDQAR
jgi:serine/threonine protein kinase/uncharacterized protein YecT (DUF1311 family)